MTDWRTLLFGAWAVAWRVWLIQSSLGVPILLLRLRGILDLNGSDLVISALVGPALSGAVLWIASVTVLRGRRIRPAQPALVIAVWLLAACARAMGFVAYLAIVGRAPGLTAVQLVTGVIFAFGWTMLLTYVVASSSYSRDRAEDATVLLQITREQERERAAMVAAEAARLAQIINETLLPDLDRLRGEISSLEEVDDTEQWRLMGERVGGIVIDQVRSASRDVTDSRKPPVVGRGDAGRRAQQWRHLFDDVASMPLVVSLPAALYAGFGLLVAVPRLGPVGYVVTCVAVLIAVAVLLACRGVIRLVPAAVNRAWVTLGSYALAGLAAEVVISHLPGVGEVRSTWAPRIFTLAIAVLVGGVASVVTQYQRRWNTAYVRQLELIERYQKLEAELAREQVRLRRQGAQLLHGPVQGNLAAVTLCLKLQAALPPHEFSAARGAALERALALVDDARTALRSTMATPGPTENDISILLQDLRDSWAGLIDIEVAIDSAAVAALYQSPSLCTMVATVLEEAVTNASRHGNARRMTIVVSPRRDIEGIRLIAENDGWPVASDFTIGFGLRSLDAFDATWTLQPGVEAGSRLVVDLPIPASH